VGRVLRLKGYRLRRLLASYATYYNAARALLALDKDAPLGRTVMASGQVRAVPILGTRRVATVSRPRRSGDYRMAAAHSRPMVADTTLEEAPKRPVEAHSTRLAAIWALWLPRKARQPGEGGPRRRGMYLATVDCAISIPSFSNSP
jgi:hypothetical protein